MKMPAGGITQLTGDVTAGPGSGSQVATLANTGVVPGVYTNPNITVDSKGRVTAASSGSGGSGGITQLTGDVLAGPGSGTQISSLSNTSVVPGSYTSANITVDSKGRITAASNGSGGGTGTTNSVILVGNATGIYSVPGMSSSNRLLCGFSARDDLSSANFNFSPLQFVLVSNQINPVKGWYVGLNTIIDPAGIDWTGYSLVWLYE